MPPSSLTAAANVMCCAVPALLCLLCSMEAAKTELLSALDEAERQSGGELTGSNDKGWEVRGAAEAHFC